MDYRQVLQELEESKLSKDKEMLKILDNIKHKSSYDSGDSDRFEMADSELASIITDIDLSDESKDFLTMLGKSSDKRLCTGIKKDYSTDECIITPEEQLEVINENQIYKVEYDDNMQKWCEKVMVHGSVWPP